MMITGALRPRYFSSIKYIYYYTGQDEELPVQKTILRRKQYVRKKQKREGREHA